MRESTQFCNTSIKRNLKIDFADYEFEVLSKPVYKPSGTTDYLMRSTNNGHPSLADIYSSVQEFLQFFNNP